jgi:transposase
VRRRAAELVGKGATCKEAGAAVGFCERTVREWLKRPELDALAGRCE